MKGLVWKLALVSLAACGSGAGNTDDNDGGSSSPTGEMEEGWWIEIEAAGMEIPRLEGRVIVTSLAAGATSNVRGDVTGRDRSASFSLIMPDFPGGTGTFADQAVTMWYRGEPAYTCRSRGITLTIQAADPFQATFEGAGECWEGGDVAPADPENPGERLEGVEATITGSIVE